VADDLAGSTRMDATTTITVMTIMLRVLMTDVRENLLAKEVFIVKITTLMIDREIMVIRIRVMRILIRSLLATVSYSGRRSKTR